MAASVCSAETRLLGQAQALPIGIEPKPLAAPAVAGFDLDHDVEQHHVGHDAAAELDRRAVGDSLAFGLCRTKPYVGSLGHDGSVDRTKKP